jgi:hypothetical protein
VELRAEDRRGHVVGFRLYQDVAPVDLVVEAVRDVRLKPYQRHITASVSLVHGSVEHFFDERTFLHHELFRPGHEAARGIGRTISAAPDFVGQSAERARIREHAMRSPLL